jgi:hypothetical protein
MRRLGLAPALLTFLCLVAPAHARSTANVSQTVRLHATIAPERLGHGAAIGVSFQVVAPAATIPSPITEFNLDYPEDLGIAVSGLGVETCTLAVLETLGPAGCPRDSLMGYGSAQTEFAAGPKAIREPALITIVRAPTEDGRLSLFIHASGENPVIAELNFPALFLPTASPLDAHLQTHIPLIPSLPGAPYVAVVDLSATLGPHGLLYTEQVGDTTVTYRPGGILLPPTCPRGGFRFAATFGFEDGGHAAAKAVVPCPRR